MGFLVVYQLLFKNPSIRNPNGATAGMQLVTSTTQEQSVLMDEAGYFYDGATFFNPLSTRGGLNLAPPSEILMPFFCKLGKFFQLLIIF